MTTGRKSIPSRCGGVLCSPDEQARRLRKREGERYSNFVERWIPLEEGYFANYSIEENSEMMVVTD